MKNQETHGYLEATFRRISRNLEKLFGMKDEMKGLLIFKSHKYSARQLLESSEYAKIISFAEKIADDIKNWQEAGNLDMETKRVYNANRDYLDARVHDLEEAIKNREKTWWDKVKDFFARLWDFISRVLPRLILNVLLKMSDMPGLLGFVGQKLVAFNSGMIKALTAKEDVYISTPVIEDLRKWKEINSITEAVGIWESADWDEGADCVAYFRLEVFKDGAMHIGPRVDMRDAVKKTAKEANISESVAWEKLFAQLKAGNGGLIDCGNFHFCFFEDGDIEMSQIQISKMRTQLKIPGYYLEADDENIVLTRLKNGRYIARVSSPEPAQEM